MSFKPALLRFLSVSFLGGSLTLPAMAQEAQSHSQRPLRLGTLSEKYESSSRGPETVSTGVGDPGGVSYGTYQLASAIGNADRFVEKYFASEFKGLKGGTPEFTSVWKKTVALDPIEFHAKEHEFIKETHYDLQVKQIQSQLKIDTNARTSAFQNVVWSCAVQHGPYSKLIVESAKNVVDLKSDFEWINAIYKERGRTDDKGNLVHFKRVSDEWKPALTRRFKEELEDALKMLKESAE